MTANQSLPPAPRPRAARFFLGASLAVTGLALLWVGMILQDFHASVQTLPPGRPIRPMGVTLGLALGSAAAILLGDGFALVAVLLAWRQHRRRLLLGALLAGLLAWLPTLMGQIGFAHIVSSRHLVVSK